MRRKERKSQDAEKEATKPVPVSEEKNPVLNLHSISLNFYAKSNHEIHLNHEID